MRLAAALLAILPLACSRPVDAAAPAPAPNPAAVSPALSPAAAKPARSEAAATARGHALAAARKTLDAVLSEAEAGRAKGKKAARTPAQIGFLAASLEGGETISAFHESALREGASNVKLFTTAAALQRLGRDFRFETRFATDATLAEGTLQGDVWAIGGGDPTLSADFADGGAAGELGRVADVFRARGVTRIAGALVLDDRLFTDAAYHPLWPAKDRGKPHALDVSALLVEHDRVTVEARANGEGEEVSIACVPPYTGWRVESLVRVVGAKEGPGSIVAHVDGDALRVSGTVPRGGVASTSFATLQPARLFGAVARGVFEERGIVFDRDPRRPAAGEAAPAKTWVVLPSHAPLDEVIRHTNRESDNLLADMILKVLGAKAKGDGSFAGGVAAVRDVLEELRVPAAGYEAVDGSGLSHESKISATAVVDLLRAMARTPNAEVYRTSLAAGGEAPGTLRHRFREPFFSGKLRAKTGSLQGVTALSGYVTALSGETILFSMLTTYDERAGVSYKADEERAVRALADIASP